MEFAPDGRLFVAEQGGALRVIKNGALLPTPFVTLTVNSVGRARPARHRLRSRTSRPTSFVYVYYTATTPTDPQPRQPVHRQRRRRGAGQRSACSSTSKRSSATNHNGGAIHFGAGRQAVRRRRRERRRLQRADADQPARQDPAHQRRRHDPGGQPVLQHGHRRQPRDLGAGPAQPLHVRLPARHRPDVHQRRRPEHLGRDQRRRGRRELRLAHHRGRDIRPPLQDAAVRLQPFEGLRDHRRRVLQPGDEPVPDRSTPGTISSPTTAAAGFPLATQAAPSAGSRRTSPARSI